MAVDVEGIPPGLGSSVEQVTLPFDATRSTQMTMRTTHNVVKDNAIQLSRCPPSCKGIEKIRANTLAQLAAAATLDGLYETRTLSIRALGPSLRRVQYHPCLKAAPPILDLA
jgi:hypothetical protein